MVINRNYEIILTDFAKTEINDIFEYIAKKLNNKIAADILMGGIEDMLLELKYNPYIAAKIHIKPRDEIYRRLVINNYVIIYQIDENKKEVIIYRVLYGRRDYLNS